MGNFIEITGLEQNTPEWEEWRRGLIGASDAPVLMIEGGVFGKTPFALWMMKLGLAEAKFTEVAEEHMKRGHELEPAARELFIKHSGIYVEPLCVQSATHPFMAASLDGISLDRRVVVEVKAPAEGMFTKMLESNETPSYYIDQLQHQFAVTEAEEIYFWAYNPDVEPYFFLKRHEPDRARIEEIVRREGLFKKHVDFRVPPGVTLGLENSEVGFTGLTLFCGYAKVGKDLYGTIHGELLRSHRFAFADPLKKVYCEQNGISLLKMEANKDKHREGLIAIGHGMRQVDPNVWVNGVFNPRTGIFEAMSKAGAYITDCRYINEASAGRRWAKKLGVPFRLIWIERPGVGPVHKTEAETTALLKQIADIIIVNDTDIRTQTGLRSAQLALLHAMNIVPDGKSPKTLFASTFNGLAASQSRKPDAKKQSATRRKAGSRARR